MGLGRASGEGAAEKAAKAAIESPLLETSIDDARGVIINFTTSKDVSLEDVDLAASMITAAANDDANIIWGISYDDNMKDEMMITVIATGFEKTDDERIMPVQKKTVQVEEKPAASSDRYDDSSRTIDPDDYLDDILNVFRNKPDSSDN